MFAKGLLSLELWLWQSIRPFLVSPAGLAGGAACEQGARIWLCLSSSARQRKCGGRYPRDSQSKGNVWFLLSCTRRPSLHLPFLRFSRRSWPPGAIGKPPASAVLVPAWQGFTCRHLNALLDPDGAELGWVRRHQPCQKSAAFPRGHPGTPCRRGEVGGHRTSRLSQCT